MSVASESLPSSASASGDRRDRSSAALGDMLLSLYDKSFLSARPRSRASCFNCAEGLRPERLARRLKRGGLAGEVLPALDYDVTIFGVKFHHAAVAGGLFAGDQG